MRAYGGHGRAAAVTTLTVGLIIAGTSGGASAATATSATARAAAGGSGPGLIPTGSASADAVDPGFVRPPLRPGDKGEQVKSLQRRLQERGYWVGRIDGRYNLTTQQAVMAAQKVNGLRRTGFLDARTWKAIRKGAMPTPKTRLRGRVVEIDKKRQILLLVNDRKLSMVVNTSTGARGWTTPSGSWRFTRQINRWHTAPLGRLYRPKFFHKGYAVHGSLSIPGYPASHGCARVSVPAMDMLWTKAGIRLKDPIHIY